MEIHDLEFKTKYSKVSEKSTLFCKMGPLRVARFVSILQYKYWTSYVTTKNDFKKWGPSAPLDLFPYCSINTGLATLPPKTI
jgi:hypothetical protein